MADQSVLFVPEPLRVLRQWQGQQQLGGRISEYWADVLDKDATGGLAIGVCEVIIGGVRMRGATVPVNSTSGTDGSDHSTMLQLVEEPEIAHDYEIGNGVSRVRSVALTLSADVFDPAAMVLAGMVLTGYGEFALETQVSDHDRRYAVIQGEIAGGVKFGAVRKRGESELVELEIVDPKASSDVRLPLWVVDSDRFASFTLHKTAVGQRIPLLFNGYPGVPAVRVDDVGGARRFVFAHGHGWDTSNALVYVNGVVFAAGSTPYSHGFVELYDDQGEPFTAVEFTNPGTAWEDSDAVHVDVAHLTDNAVSIIEMILRVVRDHTPLGQSGANQALFSSAEEKLGFYAPKVIINSASGASASGALKWIEEGLLDQFPMISMVWDVGGYGPVVTDRRADTVMDLVVGAMPLLDRVSAVTETPKEECFNEFILRYSYDPILDIYQSVVVRGAGNNAICETSRSLLGPLYADPIEAPYIQSDELANRVINWLVEHQALPSYSVVYEGLGSLFWALRRGDNVRLTDNELGWTQEVATVESIRYRRGRVELGLRVWLLYTKLGGPAVDRAPAT